jgi:hypothetical protein
MGNGRFARDVRGDLGKLVVRKSWEGALDEFSIIFDPVGNAPTVSVLIPPNIPVALVLKSILGCNEAALESGGLRGEKTVETTHS